MGACHSTKLGCAAGTIDCIGGTSKAATKHEAELISACVEAQRLMPEFRWLSHRDISKLKKLVLRNQDLAVLVKDYLRSVALAMKFLSALKLSLADARKGQAVMAQALKCYGKEASRRGRRSSASKYLLTLSKLKEFVEAGSPFSGLQADEFTSLFHQQASIIENLATKKEDIKERLRSVKKWKKAFKVLLNAAFLSVLVLSVVLAVMGAPAFAMVAASAGCSTIKTVEQWLDAVWADWSKALEGEKDVVAAMMKGEIGARDLETVRARLKRLEVDIESISGLAESVVERGEEEEIAVEVAVEEMIGKAGEIEEGIQGVEAGVGACGGEIQKAVAQFISLITSD